MPVPAVRWGMGDALGGLVLAFVASTIAVFSYEAITGDDVLEGLGLGATLLLQVPLWAGLLGAPLYATYRKGQRSLAGDFGMTMKPRDIPIGLGVGILAQFVLGILLQLVYWALDIDATRAGESARELAGRAIEPIDVVLLIVIVVIAAPVLEELFYRGLWLRAIQRRAGAAAAVVLSSLLFGIVHFQVFDFLALAGFGLVAAGLTLRTGRLGAAIWAHVAFNATAVGSLLLL